jgi:hypothetical protein
VVVERSGDVEVEVFGGDEGPGKGNDGANAERDQVASELEEKARGGMMSLDREQDKERDEKERRTIGKSCPVVSTVTTPSLSLAATTRKDIMPRTRPDIAPTVQPHMFAFFQTMAQATGTTADPIKQPI